MTEITSFFSGTFFSAEFFHVAQPSGPVASVPYIYIMPLSTGYTQVVSNK